MGRVVSGNCAVQAIPPRAWKASICFWQSLMSGETKQPSKGYYDHTQCALAIDAITLLIGHRRGLFIYICRRVRKRCGVAALHCERFR